MHLQSWTCEHTHPCANTQTLKLTTYTDLCKKIWTTLIIPCPVKIPDTKITHSTVSVKFKKGWSDFIYVEVRILTPQLGVAMLCLLIGQKSLLYAFYVQCLSVHFLHVLLHACTHTFPFPQSHSHCFVSLSQ